MAKKRKPYGSKKKIGGKTYELGNYAQIKRSAKEIARLNRKRGWKSVRVVKVKDKVYPYHIYRR